MTQMANVGEENNGEVSIRIYFLLRMLTPSLRKPAKTQQGEANQVSPLLSSRPRHTKLVDSQIASAANAIPLGTRVRHLFVFGGTES